MRLRLDRCCLPEIRRGFSRLRIAARALMRSRARRGRQAATLSDNVAMPEDRHRLLWRRTRRLTALLLAIWLLANLAGPWFARSLNGVKLAGVPLGYWLATQGFLLLYLVIIVAYVVHMNRAEARFHAAAQDSDADEVHAADPARASE